jgi:hypothetical protein
VGAIDNTVQLRIVESQDRFMLLVVVRQFFRNYRHTAVSLVKALWLVFEGVRDRVPYSTAAVDLSRVDFSPIE